MTSRILPCIVPLLLAVVAHADPGELFPGKGRDPASQPEVRPIVVAPPPASQPAAKLPTSQPEVLTVKAFLARIPEACWNPKTDAVAASQALRDVATAVMLLLPTKGGTVESHHYGGGKVIADTLRYSLPIRYQRAVRNTLVVDISVTVTPGHKMSRTNPRARVTAASLTLHGDCSRLHITCVAP